MKKKDLLGLFGLMLMTVYTLTACGSDSDDDDPLFGGSSGIVGEWAYMEYDNNELYMECINFKSNGTFSVVEYDCTGSNLNSDSGRITYVDKGSFSGTYTTANGVVTMTVNGQTSQCPYSVSSSQLMLTINGSRYQYDKVTDDIREVFNSAERFYQNQ